jgi:hypothetical protein
MSVDVGAVEKLQTTIKELEQRLAKFEEEDNTISRITEDKEPVVRKDTPQENVFAGVFSNIFAKA